MEVDVACSHNNACFQLNFAGRSFDCNAWCAFNVAGFADRGFHAEAECVCAGYFQLRCRTDRAKDSDLVEFSFGADYGYLLICCKLSGLG
ncbi:hypothetical protein D3C75_1105260 [compost metagenome]